MGRKPVVPFRGAARWTPLEVLLIIASVLLIIFPLYAEAYRWIDPVSVPAAQLEATQPVDPRQAVAPQATRATFTPAPETPTIDPNQPTATDTPADTPVPTSPPADTPTTDPNVPTNTPEPTSPPADTPTADPNAPTATDAPTATEAPTTDPNAPTATPEPTIDPNAPTAVPTDIPPTVAATALATLTPIVGESPLTIEKVASVGVANINGEFSYALSVFSDSATPLGAQVTDSLDSNTVFVSAVSSKGSCSASGNTVTCSVTVQNNAPVAITLRVRVAGSATTGSRIRNQASVRDDANNSATSDPVFVEVSGVASTTAPTSSNPNQPTAVPATSAPGAPTSAPAPTSSNGGGSGGGNNGGGGSGSSGSKSRATEPVPTAPPLALLPPTPALGPASAPQNVAPTRRPGTTVAGVPASRTRTPVPAARTTVPRGATAAATAAPGTATTTATGAPTATSTPSTPTQVALDPGLFFRMASDWGSIYPGNDVYYVIVLKNNRPADGAALNNLRITSVLPTNLEVVSAKADRGDLKQDQNNLALQVDTLKPGEGIEIGVQTRVKQGVAAGTQIIGQASVFYDGLALPGYSNIVTVQVVDAVAASNQAAQPVGTTLATSAAYPAPAATGAATAAATTGATAAATSAAYPAPATAAATTGATAAATANATSSPAANATGAATEAATGAATAAATSTPTAAAAPTATIGGAAGSGALPSTSTGVPLFGFVLLGLTMITRTVRLHRAQTRL